MDRNIIGRENGRCPTRHTKQVNGIIIAQVGTNVGRYSVLHNPTRHRPYLYLGMSNKTVIISFLKQYLLHN